MNKKISIIIVHYKVKKYLFNCIKSIYKSSYKNFEIIVVDNDEIKKISKELLKKFPKVKYVESPGNIGYGRGNNLGSLSSTGEYLFFLNPDTEIEKNTLKNLLTFFSKNKKIGIVAPLLLDKNNELMKKQGSSDLTPKSAILNLTFLSKFTKFRNNNYWHQDWDKKAPEEVDVVPGTAFMIKKKLFNEIHGFDEDFFLFFEENQICQKVKKSGCKIFMLPVAKVKHYWGESTKLNPNIEKIFKKSRFLYFRKNYGLINAVLVTIFLNFGKNQLLILAITLLSLFLNLFEINNKIRFIGDQAWFYISARDMLLTGNIPLVGITSSHTWLHQGALWTYILALTLKIFNFNPLPGYFLIGILGSISVYLVYKLGQLMFSAKVGLIASFIYATSPLIVIHSRLSYHTSPIPFFTILLLFTTYKWIRGNILYFPLSVLLIGILYNLELATFGMIATFVFVVFIGLVRKQKFAAGIFKLKIISLSAIALFLTMLPMIIYDFSHGFPQTLKFGVWIMYRIALFLGYSPIHPQIGGENWHTFYNYNSLLARDFIFSSSLVFSFIILMLAYLFFCITTIKIRNKKNIRVGYFIVFLFFTLPFVGFLSQKTNSEAYLLIFFPTASLILGIFFSGLMKNKLSSILIMLTLLIISYSNIKYLFKTNFITDISYNDRVNAAKYIIKEANGRPYNLIGVGAGSEYRSFTMNHEYLTWYLGHPPSSKKEKLRFVIYEEPYKIDIREENL